MARRQNSQNAPEVVIAEESGVRVFPALPDNRASKAPGPGLIKCVCVTKCYRDGLIKRGEVRYFREAPQHFRAADDEPAKAKE